MGWGCSKHEMDRGSEAWKEKVAEVTPSECRPWGRDGAKQVAASVRPARSNLRENLLYTDLDVMEAAAEILEEHCMRSCSVRSVLRELRG